MRKKNRIGIAEIRAAAELLASYRRARAGEERRIRSEEEWFRMRVAPKAHANSEGESFAPTSAWLLNAILQKHADMMDHFPTAVCLAREPEDEQDAAALSAVLPVILERGEFSACYADNAWTKLKHGYCLYGVLWNPKKDNGAGDIEVCRIDPLGFYFESGVRDLQDSRAVFCVSTQQKSEMLAQYPHARREALEMSEDGETVTVVDWYYKRYTPTGKKVLHYCKFSGDAVLFATENEPEFAEGFYEHGQYPFVMDVLYPVVGDCTGFGMIAIGKNPQSYIDRMDRNLLEYMDWATRVRYFCKKNTGVNEADFLDVTRRVVEVEGDVGEERLRPISVEPLADIWLKLKTAKVDELKETTFNRNVLQGAAEGGITAAAAIAALQEAGGKGVRDMIAASYRAYVKMLQLVISCVRQFYDEERYFRIMGENGYQYVRFSGKALREKKLGTGESGMPLSRLPVFDIDVRAERADAYSRVSLNENLKELYALGIFAPENREAASMLLSAMDFTGVKKLRYLLEHTTPTASGQMAVCGLPKAFSYSEKDPIYAAFSGAERKAREARDEA